ncbi:MAG: SCO family protein [Bacteroidota bacterium]
MKQSLFALLLVVCFACQERNTPSEGVRIILPQLDCEQLITGTESDSNHAAYQLLCEATGATDQYAIAQAVDQLKVAGPSQTAAAVITSLLPEYHSLYRGRGPREANRLRTYLLAALGTVGVPEAALPYIVAELKHFNPQNKVLIAAAARAAGALTDRQALIVPYLSPYLEPGFPDEEMDLDEYNAFYPFEHPTYLKLEVLRSLQQTGTSAQAALSILHRVKASKEPSIYTRRAVLAEAVTAAITAIDPQGEWVAGTEHPPTIEELYFVEEWLPLTERPDRPLPTVELESHRGQPFTFNEFEDKPFAMTFYYSSCANFNKCSMTVSKFRDLEQLVAEEGMAEEVNLCAITLDPRFDLPIRNHDYFVNRGGELREFMHILSGEEERIFQLFDELDVGVAHYEGEVVLHDIELILFDKKGRMVRRYSNTHWNEVQLIEDLRRLAQEDMVSSVQLSMEN